MCELLRQIYNMTDDPEIKVRCRMATTFAKKMAMMVTEFRGAGWGRGLYPWNPDRRHERIRARWEGKKEKENDQT